MAVFGSSLYKSNHFDLRQYILGQSCSLHAGTCGLACEISAVNFVEFSEIVHICQKAGGLDNIVKGAARLCKHGFEVFADLTGLSLNVCGFHISRSGVYGYLPRGEQQAAAFDRLGIGTYGVGGVLGVDFFGHGKNFLSGYFFGFL